LPVQLEALREELVVVHRALEVAFFHS
jgi:hypothetical protein